MHRTWMGLVGAALLIMPGVAQAGTQGWKTASDVGAYGLISLSIGLPAVRGDKQGAFQAGGSFAATSVVTEGLKQTFPRWRPDGSDRKSFPSGHTSRSFAAAASIYNRQGPALGIPALAVAGFVGLARVEGKKHYWSDVAVGAGLGTAIGFLITRDRPEAQTTAFMPWADTSGGGFTFAAQF